MLDCRPIADSVSTAGAFSTEIVLPRLCNYILNALWQWFNLLQQPHPPGVIHVQEAAAESYSSIPADRTCKMGRRHDRRRALIMSKLKTVTRYHGALVTLHWLMAFLLLFALGMGSFVLSTTPNSDPGKIAALQGHMVGGGLILLLTLVRLGVRLKSTHPAPASTGHAMLDRLAPLTHWGLYLLVLMMAGSGVAMSVLAGLPDIVFGGVGSLPVNFDSLPPRAVHGVVAKLLMLAIGMHIVAALYHQFVRRDGLLARMGYGPR